MNVQINIYIEMKTVSDFHENVLKCVYKNEIEYMLYIEPCRKLILYNVIDEFPRLSLKGNTHKTNYLTGNETFYMFTCVIIATWRYIQINVLDFEIINFVSEKLKVRSCFFLLPQTRVDMYYHLSNDSIKSKRICNIMFTDAWEQHIMVVYIPFCHGIKEKVTGNNKFVL